MARRYRYVTELAKQARKSSRPKARRGRGKTFSPWTPWFVVGPLAVFTAVFLWDGGPPGWAVPLDVSGETPLEQVSARFDRCNGPVRYTCVVDGDTIWYRGNKIRIADINTPELSEPECASEAALAEKATSRLTALLNDGPFTIRKQGFGAADTDRYGRLLRVLSRDGESLGEVLVREGYAERWKGYRGSWC
ncbi:MAG: thermonuclease family protein [Novosphingobium sp.]|nr:thermonuclease family protein [Novosphingobium sp.]